MTSPRLRSPSRRSTLEKTCVRQIRRNLLAWYDAHRRALPWRGTRDPYRVWISEVMLQQTRVAVVRERYDEFLRRFTDVRTLASARVADVLAAWSGLGYYRRARSLHAAAKIVCRIHGGVMPGSSAALATLPGIGRYTAAAVASIAYGEPVAVVDGNVARVVSRMFGDAAGEIHWAKAQQLLEVKRPGDFNQAMMELGATVCVPGKPLCTICPVASGCATRGSVHRPLKSKRHKREVHYRLATLGDKVFLVRRPQNVALMPGMWQLPEGANSIRVARFEFSVRHSITDTDYVVRVVRCGRPGGVRGRWVEAGELERLPLTGLTRKILRRATIIQSRRRAPGL
jgi:A/G-specific adenine glycosylase